MSWLLPPPASSSLLLPGGVPKSGAEASPSAPPALPLILARLKSDSGPVSSPMPSACDSCAARTRDLVRWSRRLRRSFLRRLSILRQPVAAQRQPGLAVAAAAAGSRKEERINTEQQRQRKGQQPVPTCP